MINDYALLYGESMIRKSVLITLAVDIIKEIIRIW